eukprot:1012883-Rhodomonas_salina.1
MRSGPLLLSDQYAHNRPTFPPQVSLAVSLRALYAMSDTDVQYGAKLSAFAKSGTGIVHEATLPAYAASGTDSSVRHYQQLAASSPLAWLQVPAYARAMRCPVLS